MYAIFVLLIPCWVIQRYPLQHFWESILFWSILVYLHETIAELLAALVKNPIIGTMYYLAFWILSFLFSGLFLPAKDLFWPLKGLYYATPFNYYIRGMFYLLYSDATFEPCSRTENPTHPICVDDGDGLKVLEALHYVLPQFEKSSVVRDMLVPFLMIVLLKFTHTMIVIYKASIVSIPKNRENNRSCRDDLTSIEEGSRSTCSEVTG